MLLGEQGVDKLNRAHVAVFGVGGVGGYVVEALVRAGVGALDLFDADTVSLTNLNRQIIALHSTVGQYKTDVAAARAREINPDVRIEAHHLFYLPENADSIPLDGYDYIVDAIDTVTAKLELISRAKAVGTPIISSMGTGNKLGYNFEIADIKKTSVCPLAKVMRKELKSRGIDSLTVLFSKEQPITPVHPVVENGRHIPASISFPPAIAGLMIAGHVIQSLISK